MNTYLVIFFLSVGVFLSIGAGALIASIITAAMLLRDYVEARSRRRKHRKLNKEFRKPRRLP